MPRILMYDIALVVGALLAGGCDTATSISPPQLTTVSLTIADSTIEAGRLSSATAQALDQSGQPLAALVTYSSSAPLVAAIDPRSGVIFAISSGTAQISATVGGKTNQRTLTVLKARIVLNEIRPDGDGPAGWVELHNTDSTEIDISGWRLTASDVFQGFTLPQGTRILPYGYRVINEVNFPLGLNAADAVHLFSPYGVLVETFRWLTDPPLSFNRCPDGFGPFVSSNAITRGGPNLCQEENQ